MRPAWSIEGRSVRKEPNEVVNLRIEHRIPALEVGEVIILGRPDVTVSCAIENFSRSGMCITVDQDIDAGRIVKVNWGENFLIGRVERVFPVGAKFRVGVELLYCSKWAEPETRILQSRESCSA
jgi:hypothetical protein